MRAATPISNPTSRECFFQSRFLELCVAGRGGRAAHLRVASRTSAFSFKGKDVDIPTVAQKLNVATMLEGSVRRSGKRVRITVQLIQVATDSHLWSETYDRELDGIFAVQDDIAQSVVKELRAALLREPTGATAGAAAAAAGLARVLGRLDDALELVRKAVALDPLSSRTHRQMALVCLVNGRLDDAAAAFRLALDLNPSAGVIDAFLAMTRLLQGRPEEGLALAKAESHDVFRNMAFATIHHALGNSAESDAALRALSDGFGWTAAYQVAEVYAYRNEVEKAFEWLERAYAQRDPGVAFSATDEFLRPLNGDPRWQPFLQRMSLP